MRLDEIAGCWALVTGASSGIGREFCRQLAAAGLHLAMVARRESLLIELAGECEKAHGTKTLVLPLDLARSGAARDVKARLDERSVRVRLLCNNAATGRWGPCEDTSAETYEQMIQLNAATLVALSTCLLPDLTSHPTSAIINVSSQAAYQPVPYMAVYAATKAFVHSFSQALYGEWQDRGVLVQTLVPGPTATEFDDKAGAYPSAVRGRGTAEEVVRRSLAHLAGGKPVVPTVKGTFQQRLFAAIAPPKLVIAKVASMFRPPKNAC